jgi:hypothetical protein
MRPFGSKIKLDIKPVKIGAIQSDSVPEYATILDIGPDVDEDKFAVGETLVFKAWAVDVVTVGEEKHYFIDSNSEAILALMD